MTAELARLFAHLQWADDQLLRALVAAAPLPPEALREMAHVVAAEEVWLSRLQQRPSRVPVWPEMTLGELQALAARTHADFVHYLDTLTDGSLAVAVQYVNSAGRGFETAVGDILLHVALHGQHHRGKVNLLLRQAGQAPAPADYIAFVRGAPAAITRR